MKNLITLLLFSFLISNSSFGQYACYYAAEGKEPTMFYKRVKVALLGDKQYDDAMKSAVEKYWKITSFEFFNYREMSDDYKKNTMLKDTNNVFLLPLIYDVNPDDLLDFNAGYLGKLLRYVNASIYLSLIEGGHFSNYRNGPTIRGQGMGANYCYAPFDCWGYESYVPNISYRLDWL